VTLRNRTPRDKSVRRRNLAWLTGNHTLIFMAEERRSGLDVGGVDPGALVLAGAGAAFSFISQPGDWSPLSLIVGVALTFVVIAYHHQAPGPGTPRHWLLRLAFGAVLGLTLGITLAWPLQQLVMVHLYGTVQDDNGNSSAGISTTMAVYWIWPVLTVIPALLEPRMTRALDATRHRRAKDVPAEATKVDESVTPSG
jgi:hypothetical protein